MTEPAKCEHALNTRVAVLEASIERLEEYMKEAFAARDKALELQATSNKEHFLSLNHESQRILKATEITVSRDTWTEFLKGFTAWQQAIDRAIQNAVPRAEFQSYKESTQTALTLKAGQTQGVGLTIGTIVQLVASIAGLAVVAAFVFSLMKH